MLKIFKVEGDSMYPLLKHKDKVFCISRIFSKLSIGDIVVLNLPKEGLMIKEITRINWQGYYVKGTIPNSIDSSVFGYIEKKDILYKMLFKF